MAKDYSNDILLLGDLKNGSLSAYEYLYGSSVVRLTILALSILEDEEMARDLVQEFFIDFWDQQLFNNISISLRAYLYYSVRNRAFRLKKNGKKYSRLINGLSEPEPADNFHYLENAELKQAIEIAINRLPPMARKTFEMHYIDNLSHQDISKALGISKQTVGNHIHKALAALRIYLKEKL